MGGYRVPTGPGILEKSWNLKIVKMGPGKVLEFEKWCKKSWKMAKGPGKLCMF